MALATFSQRIHPLLMSMFLGVAAGSVVLAPPAAATVHVAQYVEVPQCRPIPASYARRNPR
jgi:hypothetical protein